MDFKLISLDLDAACTRKTDALVVLVGDDFEPGRDPLSGLIGKARASGDFKTAAGTCMASWGAAGVAAPRLLLCGTGDGSPACVRRAVAGAIKALRATPAVRATLCFVHLPDDLLAPVLAAADAAYVYETTRSRQPHDAPGCLRELALAGPGAVRRRAAFERAVAVSHGVQFAREWANRPANHATPSALARAARGLARQGVVTCRVLGPRETDRLGMGALHAVAQGSREPLRFIELHYRGAPATVQPVVLVGKGITFDAGGISIKPAVAMDEMKFDMAGAASVLGVFRALGELRPAINVIGLIPSCENLPGGGALKPGDVITGLSGQTIEVLNTDAEGRLVLSDALTYAARFKPRALIDMATLTGACVIALGDVRSGLFSTSDELAGALLQAGEQTLDPCWRMPLDDAYADGLRSNFADVANVAGRGAGAVTAAKFLQRFSGDCAWAHLDIAGTAWKKGDAKGATGRPVPLLLHYLLTQVDGAAAPATGRKRAAAVRRRS